MNKKLASYIRVSTDKQDTARQRESVQKWADGRGLPILFAFEDSEGKNPRDQSAKRIDFQRMLKAVEAGAIDCIIVDSQDRFGTKDAYEFGKFITFLREHGCELWSVGQGLLSADDDATILTNTIGALTSSREQKEKAARNVSGKVQKARLGEYQGGYPPYGCDVVCIGNGAEKWRVHIVGHYKRLKIYPDGTREEFNGKDNFPATDPSDCLRYRPTIDELRLRTVRQVFRWYATEDVSPGQIAERLNESDIPTAVASLWNKVAVRTMLKNPVYIGLPAWNKRGASRFKEFVGGNVKDVTTAKAGRWREKSDYVQPAESEFKPIVDRKTWDKVQAKLTASSQRLAGRERRPAATASLWLRPFLYCGRCNKPMRANVAATIRGMKYDSYYCGTYGTYGKNNPTGCHCHRVKASILEAFVNKYLEEKAPTVARLMDSIEADDSELFQATLDREMEAVWKVNQIALAMHSAGGDGSPITGVESYGQAYLLKRPRLEVLIEEKEAKLDEMLEGFADLSPALRNRANAKMEALQAEIDSLQGELVDLRQPWAEVCDEIRARNQALRFAVETVEKDGAWRQKTEALRSVIDRIVCHFRYEGAKSIIDRLEFIPTEGATAYLPVEVSRGRG